VCAVLRQRSGSPQPRHVGRGAGEVARHSSYEAHNDFQRVDGIVLRAAKTEPKGTRIIIMDEMNRANLPRVLGELMYLFEYRDEAVALEYSPSFSLPHDLRFIGTMNTADRSIRSIDIALRRRFDVFECKPDAAILAAWYDKHENSVPNLLDGFVRLNEVLEREIDRHHAIGHTFLITDTLNPKRLAAIWERKIGPLLEEYFFDRPDLAASFEVNQYWPSVVAGPLRHPDHTIIIDAKFYRKALAQSPYGERLRSPHLYQLITYLEHERRRRNKDLVGMLIYPEVGRSLRLRYRLLDIPVLVATVDLG
jgi:hypothetical protein